MTRNYYSEAIEIIKRDFDHKAVAIEIAKKHPKFFVQAASVVQGKSWQQQCREKIKAGKMIEAIKLCRELTGMGLKEAKEACEEL